MRNRKDGMNNPFLLRHKKFSPGKGAATALKSAAHEKMSVANKLKKALINGNNQWSEEQCQAFFTQLDLSSKE